MPGGVWVASSAASARLRRLLRLLSRKKPKAVRQRIRVGGNVQQANLIRKSRCPSIPPLAKQARIQGVVRFTAIIGKDGTHPESAVRERPSRCWWQPRTKRSAQWVYKPTLLNGEPVEVVTTIDVNFTLSQ